MRLSWSDMQKNNNNNNNKSVNQHKYTRKDKGKHVSDRDDIEVCAAP